ncbi:hypothetical protein GSI_02342 [Ganoderma sinense ZZ0214-1]|uniref:MYND-type domain-containing protein n=1 Tax=Ganoderma sinense ZZ0214-1 TaxID=1077348 RepID=A0A2G8SPB8_9APHY|nr:hypothetical protein GSI_02342 [Ganoderma sinense ZZ0214-1]
MANSGRSRRRNIHPSSPLGAFESSSEAGLKSIEDRLNKSKEAERLQQSRCSHCRKNGGDTLRTCSRCKAARYCDQTCQLADFKARHKRDCANFAHPPTTSAFLITPVLGERFPQQPVFAHAHEDGVGCWVSIAGRIDCDLQVLTEMVSPAGHGEKSFENRQYQIMESSSEDGRDLIGKYKAAAHSLLTLSVLVQNRRKEKGPILVFASRTQVVSYPSTFSAIMSGTAQGDNIVKYTRERIEYAAAGVAIDPWDKTPRLEVAYVNGEEVKHQKPSQLPPAVKDAKDGIIALNHGEYVILHLQFRVGDGDRISKDWEGLSLCETIRIPYAVWDGAALPASLLSSLPLAQTPTPTSADGLGKALRAGFNQRAVRAHYADFIERGEEAYIRAHFGDARADMVRSGERMMEMMGEMLLGQVAQAGGTDVLVQRLRDMGMGDIADKIGARGR